MHVEDLVANLIELLCAGEDYPIPAPYAVVVASHPDDEVIGLGGRLPRIHDAAFIHVTDGAPRNMKDATREGFHTREEYARARRRELLAALDLVGITPDQCFEIGLVDQEASFELPGLAHSLADVFMDIQPEIVLVPAYEGGHPDHDATAFGVHAACRLVEEQGLPPPVMVEFALYHAAPSGKGVEVFEFLPGHDSEITTVTLSQKASELKRRMMACFTTQQKAIAMMPVGLERFRHAPAYDFTRPPHAGRLYYENHDWGMTGENWRILARKALEALDIEDTI